MKSALVFRRLHIIFHFLFAPQTTRRRHFPIITRLFMVWASLIALLCLSSVSRAGMIAHWPLDGDALDVVGGYDGAVNGAELWIQPGLYGSDALEFDGTTSYVSVGDALGTFQEVSFSMLVRCDVQTDDFQALFHEAWTTGGIHCHYRNGQLSLGINGTTPSGNVVQSGTLSTGVTHHIAVTINNATGQIRFYINGVLNQDETKTDMPDDLFLGPLTFGAWEHGAVDRFFDGVLDDIRFYDHILSEQEVLDLHFLYNGFKVINPQPDDEADNVPVQSTSLSWTGYSGTDYYEVYFGTTDPPPLVKTQSETFYTPDLPLEYETPYYWKVDATVGGQPYPGNLWTFETMSEPLDPNMLGFDEIVFIKRRPYLSDHYYTVINNGTPSSLFQAENGIYIYNMRTQQERPVITAADFPPPASGTGVIGKFTLSFDATKVIFDYRDHQGDGFRIWEVNIDGTGLHQVISPPADEAEKIARWNGGSDFHTDDIDPAYLPDGGIIFSSSRCEHAILCGGSAHLAVAVLHRTDPADPDNVEQLSLSPVSEFCPMVLDDGRVMYHRWEYIDKGHRVPKTIWTMNPDGSKSQELFGLSDSYYNTGVHMYPQPLPGRKDKIVIVTAPHYPQGNSLGPIQLVDLSKDNRTLEGLTNITPEVMMKSEQYGWFFAYDNFTAAHQDGIGGPLYTHPWPVSDSLFLVSYKDDWDAHYQEIGAHAIYLIDTSENHTYIYKDPDQTMSCWHPTPLVARETPAKIFSFQHPAFVATNEALCVVNNIYEGMDGVSPGEVKWLRINEAVPRYWDTRRKWSPSFTSNSWKAALWTRTQWGVVPVETDGSAYFTVPADRSIFFQALDEDYAEIQRERTYVNYRPGEIRSCIGCHERTGRAAPPIGTEVPMALTRAPSTPQAQLCDLAENGGDGLPGQVIHYPTDIQPLLNDHCISCHGNTSPQGDLTLTGDLTTYYNTSYEQLLSKELAGYAVPEFGSITPGKGGGNDLGSYLPPKSMGCYDSLMIQMLTDPLDEDHYELLDENEMMILRRWVDSNYQYYGTYYGRHHSDHQLDPDFRRRPTFEEAISFFAPAWHD